MTGAVLPILEGNRLCNVAGLPVEVEADAAESGAVSGTVSCALSAAMSSKVRVVEFFA